MKHALLTLLVLIATPAYPCDLFAVGDLQIATPDPFVAVPGVTVVNVAIPAWTLLDWIDTPGLAVMNAAACPTPEWVVWTGGITDALPPAETEAAEYTAALAVMLDYLETRWPAATVIINTAWHPQGRNAWTDLRLLAYAEVESAAADARPRVELGLRLAGLVYPDYFENYVALGASGHDRLRTAFHARLIEIAEGLAGPRYPDTCAGPLRGDLNHDGRVSGADYTVWASNWARVCVASGGE